MLNIHGSNQKHTENQDALLTALAENLSEEGTYFLPNIAPGTSKEDQQSYMESIAGNPWAIITYNKSFDTNMGMNMFRSFVTNCFVVFILCWLLGKVSDLNMMTTVIASIGVGLIGFLNISYINSIWFEGNTIPELIDAIVQWGLCGVWLGWFLNRK